MAYGSCVYKAFSTRGLTLVIGFFRWTIVSMPHTKYRDGWWTGILINVLERSRYKVYFDDPPKVIDFDRSEDSLGMSLWWLVVSVVVIAFQEKYWVWVERGVKLGLKKILLAF